MYDKNQEGKIFLDKREEINTHIQYVISMELVLKEIMDSGLLNLMIDYNLTWGAVYNIVKESIEEVKRND